MNEIDQLLEKAQRSLEAAHVLLKRDDYDFAVSRTYYAFFYLGEALLLIRTGELETSFHRTLHRAFDLRQESDYLSTVEITEEIAISLLSDVEREMKKGIQLFKRKKS